MERVPWWGLVVLMAAALLITWFLGRVLLQRYKARWPW